LDKFKILKIGQIQDQVIKKFFKKYHQISKNFFVFSAMQVRKP